MKPRLFWKILGAFWLTVALTTACVFAALAILSHSGRDGIVGLRRPERLHVAEIALRYGGRPAFEEVTARWPADERARVHVETRPDGRLGIVAAAEPSDMLAYWPFVVQPISALLFSAALAGYLASPIRRLRGGFRQLASGDLGVRLTPGMGRRRDEIADLAQDFDAMAERLQHLVASRERLLHDVSHELRSPLARLSLAVGLARRGEGVDAKAFSRIDTETARLNALVGDLLSLARAETETATEENYFDLAALLEVVCDDAAFEARPRGVHVDLLLAAELVDPARAPVLRGAPELFRRGVENVIRNALRFSPAGKRIEVQAELAADVATIAVRDDGPGVPASMLETMFDTFVKGSGDACGLGLGLAIARRAFAAHGGAVAARNRETGGLEIRITLPLVHSPPSTPP